MKNFVNEERLNKLCKLAKISIEEKDKERFLNMINIDLQLLEDLDEINVDGLKELTNPYDMKLEAYEDVVSDGSVVDELMECAPEELYSYFVAPKVVK